MRSEERAAKIRELEMRIADLEARLPAHSVPPAMIAELEELEEELERLKTVQRSA
ncbi:MAG: histidine kinase [Anaerolineae bacterium]|nr:MAG: histidine kinase [Anaerolineae bacterium]